MKTTSFQSHQMMIPFKERTHAKILNGLSVIRAGSFRDIAAASGLKERQVWKRLSELERLGKIKDTKTTKTCPETNRKVTIWEIC